MITVKLPLQLVFHSFLCGFISHGHRLNLLIKGRIQFIFRNATKCLVMLIHTNVVRLIETTEHAYLRELGDTREQNKLQVIISFLEHRIYAFEQIAIIILQSHLSIFILHRNIHIHHIKQRLVILINKYNSSHSCFCVSFLEYGSKATTQSLGKLILSISKFCTGNKFLQNMLQGIRLYIILSTKRKMKHRILLPYLL